VNILFTLFFILLAVLVAAAGLWWTMKVAKKQKVYTEDEVNPAVSRHPAVLNPVFIAIAGFSIAVILIIYIAFFVY
jgi:ABC-type Fe3+ transport system permease subunit